MTKHYFIFSRTNIIKSLCFLCFFSKSYSQDILWEKSFGGKQAEYLLDAIPTADYGFILAGSTLSIPCGTKSENNKGNLDFFVDKNSFFDEKHKKSKK